MEQQQFVKLTKKLLKRTVIQKEGWKIRGIGWTKYYKMEFHVFVYAMLSVVTPDKTLFDILDLLQDMGILDVNWLAKVGGMGFKADKEKNSVIGLSNVKYEMQFLQ